LLLPFRTTGRSIWALWSDSRSTFLRRVPPVSWR
jgi:hypothetical protein